MEFRTYINIKPRTERIDHHKAILLMGSCFAQNIAAKLEYAKFKTTDSPSGILFNPESIASALESYANFSNLDSTRGQIAKELQCRDGIWFSYDFHSAFNNCDATAAAGQMSESIKLGATALNEADTVIITFGSAWVYRLNESGKVVANCHKQPQKIFSRELLSADAIISRYDKLLSEGALAGKKVIFTISPIRHLSDGLEENSLSKAILRVAIDGLVKEQQNASYFPSYEIMNDELRDYRFYADDMTHPSPMAIEYIWQRFSEYAFDESTLDIMQEIEQIQQASNHRAFNPESVAHKTFCGRMLERIERFHKLHPAIDLSKEKENFCKHL